MSEHISKKKQVRGETIFFVSVGVYVALYHTKENIYTLWNNGVAHSHTALQRSHISLETVINTTSKTDKQISS